MRIARTGEINSSWLLEELAAEFPNARISIDENYVYLRGVGDKERASEIIREHDPTQRSAIQIAGEETQRKEQGHEESPNLPYSDAYLKALASYAKYFGGE